MTLNNVVRKIFQNFIINSAAVFKVLYFFTNGKLQQMLLLQHNLLSSVIDMLQSTHNFSKVKLKLKYTQKNK